MNGLKGSWNAHQDQDAASSDEELPAKGKSTFKERSAAVGREAALQKQLQEAARDRQDLAKRYEAKDQKCNELRDKLKVTKAALCSRERELEMAQRMLQKIGQEKTQLREETADSKVYTRKLEARLDELKGAAELGSKYQAAKQKAHDLQQQLMAVNTELESCKDVAAQRAKQVERLNRALDIRASELSEEAGGQDIPAKLLHSLAESREESLELAKQLAATKAEMNKLKGSASRMSQRLEAAELMRADAEVAAEQLRQRLEKLVGSSQEVTKQRTDMGQLLVSARSEAETYKAERDELAEVVLEMQEEIEALKAATEAAHMRGEVAAAAATDQAIQHIATNHAVAEDARQQQAQREAQLNQRCAQLSQQSAQLEAALQQQLTAAQQSASARQQQILVLESQLQARRQRELELESQVARLQTEADKLGGAISSAEAAASRTSQLEHQVMRLEARVRVADVERQQLEQRLQQMRDDATAAQQEAQREIDGLRVQLASKEAAYRCALEDIEQLQKQLNQAMDRLDRASTSKAQLQHNMLHQISSIKEKLQQAELHSQQQLTQPTSPIFRNRASSSSIGLRASHSRHGRVTAAARSTSAGQIEAHSHTSMGDTIAAAALDAARRVKAASSTGRRSLGSQTTAAGPSAAPSTKQSLARHSIGSIGTETSCHQQHQRDICNPTGRGLLERQGDRQLAVAAACKVADFAASLQQADPTLVNKRDIGAAPGYQLLALQANRSLQGSPNASNRAGTGIGQLPAHIPPITISSYAGSTGFAEGDLDLDQEVGFGVRSAAAMQLASPPGSRRFTSSGGGGATATYAAGTRPDASRHDIGSRAATKLQKHKQQLMRHSSAGLADELGGEDIDWHSILRAADMPSVKVRSSSPPRSASALAASPEATAAGRADTSGSPGSHNHNSPYLRKQTAAEPVHDCHLQQQQDAAARGFGVKRCASVPPQLETLSVMNDGRPVSVQPKGPTGIPRNSCSWLQQPVEPCSPSVVPAPVGHSQLGIAPAATAAGRVHGIADPYSLPGSAEPSAASLQGVSNSSIAPAGAAGGSTLKPNLDRGWQQRQQQQQQHGSGATAPAVLHCSGPPSKQRQQHEQLPNYAAAGAGVKSAAAGVAEPQQLHPDKDATNVLHACGAWEVNLDSDSCSIDDYTSSDKGDSRRSSHSGRHAAHAAPEQRNAPNAADTAASLHTAGVAPACHGSRLEASKAALRDLSSRSRQLSSLSTAAAAAARRASENDSIGSTEQPGWGHHVAAQQGTPPHVRGVDHGGPLLTPPSTKRMQPTTMARTSGMQPVRMQGFDASAVRQQQQQRGRGPSGGSSKLHPDPSLSSWHGDEDDVQDIGKRSLLNHSRMQQQRGSAAGSGSSMQAHREQHGAGAAVVDHSRDTIENLLTKLDLLTELNEGTPTLQDLAQLEGLV